MVKKNNNFLFSKLQNTEQINLNYFLYLLKSINLNFLLIIIYKD